MMMSTLSMTRAVTIAGEQKRRAAGALREKGNRERGNE